MGVAEVQEKKGGAGDWNNLTSSATIRESLQLFFMV